MSKHLKPSYYQGRAAENAWIGLVFSTHDQICSCTDPIKHLNCLISHQKCPHFGEKDTTVATTGAGDKEEMPFDAEDLENLFKESEEDAG